MARVLIAYATVEGHTRTIAEAMGAVLVGGPIHAGKHRRELVAWATRHRLRLASLPSGFFTVCLTAAEDTEEARAKGAEYVQAFCDETGWAPRHTAVFAGMLAWTQYDFFTRLLMKLITRHQGVTDQDVKRDYDYTDYAAVRRFAAEVVPAPAPSGEPVNVRLD